MVISGEFVRIYMLATFIYPSFSVFHFFFQPERIFVNSDVWCIIQLIAYIAFSKVASTFNYICKCTHIHVQVLETHVTRDKLTACIRPQNDIKCFCVIVALPEVREWCVTSLQDATCQQQIGKLVCTLTWFISWVHKRHIAGASDVFTGGFKEMNTGNRNMN